MHPANQRLAPPPYAFQFSGPWKIIIYACLAVILFSPPLAATEPHFDIANLFKAENLVQQQLSNSTELWVVILKEGNAFISWRPLELFPC